MEKNSKELILKWKRNQKNFQKTLEKEVIIAAFEGLIKGFSNDNEISKKLVKIIPNTKEMYINWDSNDDVKKVFYTTLNETEGGIPIIYHHKIVWAILNGYCMDGDKIK